MTFTTSTRMLLVAMLTVGSSACTLNDAGVPVPAMGGAASGSAYDKPGFVTEVVDGRLWVFRPDSPELEQYRTIGEPAKHIILPGAGPDGMTVKAPDSETARAYINAGS